MCVYIGPQYGYDSPHYTVVPPKQAIPPVAIFKEIATLKRIFPLLFL